MTVQRLIELKLPPDNGDEIKSIFGLQAVDHVKENDNLFVLKIHTTMATFGQSASKSTPAIAGVGTSVSNSKSNMNSGKGQHQPTPMISLSNRFPVNSLQEITLQNGEKVSGRIYCTDETTGSVVMQTALVHTTLATEIRIVSSDSIVSSETIESSSTSTVASTPLTQPLPKIQKKVLEDRERRAIRLAEESLRHINQKVRLHSQYCIMVFNFWTLYLFKHFSN